MDELLNNLSNEDIQFSLEDNNLTIFHKNVKYRVNTLTKLQCEQYDYNTIHLLKIIKFDDSLENFVLNVFDGINNIYGYCTLCKKEILNIDVVNTCLDCVEESYFNVLDNCVINYYKHNKLAFNLLILSSMNALENQKNNELLSPFPIKFVDVINIKTKLNDVVKFDKLIDDIENMNYDYQIENMYGNFIYAFIKFIVKSNVIDLKLAFIIYKKNKFEDLYNINKFKDCILTFEINHTEQIENKFKNASNNYLYHGSPLPNWISIFKKNLKNCSGTTLQRNGAVYGSGVYLTSSIHYASNYGHHNNYTIIGVCQLLNDVTPSSGHIYVINNETDVILRYITVIIGNHEITKINNYFIELKNFNKNSCYKSIQNKRLIKEIDIINKYCQNNNFVMNEINSDNIINIIFDANNILSIQITEGYPSLSPFLWFSKTNITKKYILENGAIFKSILFKKNWMPTVKIIDLIIEIVNDINLNNNNVVRINSFEIAYNEYINEIKKNNII